MAEENGKHYSQFSPIETGDTLKFITIDTLLIHVFRS